jgi:integrase
MKWDLYPQNLMSEYHIRYGGYGGITVLGLVACAGLRAGEAVRLEIADLLLEGETPHLLVRETKFRKSRIVPLHPSAVMPIKKYLAERKHFELLTVSVIACPQPSGRTTGLLDAARNLSNHASPSRD